MVEVGREPPLVENRGLRTLALEVLKPVNVTRRQPEHFLHLRTPALLIISTNAALSRGYTEDDWTIADANHSKLLKIL